ncbi:hypothetical protein HNO89_003649 [Sporosarcina luteola]|nr:hypothetical protein [Sporosarcina luteola]
MSIIPWETRVWIYEIHSDSIKKKLAKIGLKYSSQKSLPTLIQDIKDRINEIQEKNDLDEDLIESFRSKLKLYKTKKIIDLKENERDTLRKISSIFGIKIDPEKITKSCMQSNRLSANLSTTADTKLQGLSDQELELFVQEMLFYMQINNDAGEIKEETIKIFAAWRLNSSYQEKSFRRDLAKSEIDFFLCTLIDAIKKYPYKMGFYDVYLLIILKYIEKSDNGYEELESFLVKLPAFMKSSNRDATIYFSAVRTRILNVCADNWYRFNEEQRKKLRRNIENAFLVWYANPKIPWTEQYTLYWTLSVLRIRLPIHLCMENKNGYPNYLRLLNTVYKEYIFIVEDNGEEDTFDYRSRDLYTAIYLFKVGLYWNKREKSFSYNEVDKVIYGVTKRQILSNRMVDIHNWLSFATISNSELSISILNRLEKLIKAEANDNISTIDIETHYEVLDFLQTCIKRYFENPKEHDGIVKWISYSNQNEDSYYKRYVINRFLSYTKIRSHYSLTDERLPRLITEFNSDEAVPIADWIFYCGMLPFDLDEIPSKQDVLHPLTEYEYVKLLRRIVLINSFPKEKVISDIEQDFLFSFKLTFKEWKDFRMESKVEDLHVKKIDNLSAEDTKEYVKVLFAMITNRPTHTHIKKHFSMYKWNDLQSYFEMTYYPSTKVASLFVNNLNIHQNFYQEVYKMPLEELPYRDIYTSNKNEKSIGRWIENYLVMCEKDLIDKKYNRKLELLEIDIDQLRS